MDNYLNTILQATAQAIRSTEDSAVAEALLKLTAEIVVRTMHIKVNEVVALATQIPVTAKEATVAPVAPPKTAKPRKKPRKWRKIPITAQELKLAREQLAQGLPFSQVAKNLNRSYSGLYYAMHGGRASKND